MENEIVVVARQANIQRQAETDEQLVALWLHGKPATTAAAYFTDIQKFFSFVDKPLRAVVLRDLQAFLDSMEDVSPNTRRRVIATVKSFYTFAEKLGYVDFNIGKLIKAPKAKDDLAARILTEDEILQMIYKTEKQRDNVLLRLLYASGGRVSEICALTWSDIRPNGDTGQVTLFGKGGKTRAVKLSAATWKILQAFRNGADNTQPVFKSQEGGGHLTRVQVHRIIKAAAKRAGISGNSVS